MFPVPPARPFPVAIPSTSSFGRRSIAPNRLELAAGGRPFGNRARLCHRRRLHRPFGLFAVIGRQRHDSMAGFALYDVQALYVHAGVLIQLSARCQVQITWGQTLRDRSVISMGIQRDAVIEYNLVESEARRARYCIFWDFVKTPIQCSH